MCEGVIADLEVEQVPVSRADPATQTRGQLHPAVPPAALLLHNTVSREGP